MTTLDYQNRPDTDQVMNYSFSSAAWSDCHSNVALSWEDETSHGLQRLLSLRNHGSVTLSEKLLGWSLSSGGEVLPTALTKRSFYAEKVVEKCTAGSIELTATYSWIAWNTLHIAFEVHNNSANKCSTEFQFEYETKDQSPPSINGDWPRKKYQAGRRNYFGSGLQPMLGEAPGCWHTLIDYVKDPEAPYSGSYENDGTKYPVFCFTNLQDRTLTLGGNTNTSFVVTLAFGSQRAEVHQRSLKHTAPQSSWSAQDATNRMSTLVADAPAIDPDFAGNAQWEQLYLQAIAGLNSVYIKGETGSLVGDKRIPWTCKNVLAGGFFWDTAFSSTGGVLINPKAAMESIEAFTMHTNHRGAMPANLTELSRGGEGQYPIMAWGAWNIFCATRDTDWLSRIERCLHHHIEYWFTYNARKNGICYIYNSYLGADDCARYDYCMKGKYNQPVQGIDSPDINAVLVLELQALAKMNKVLGNESKAEALQTRAHQLNQRIVDLFYFPEDNMFWDVDEGTRNIKTGTIVPHMFFPLWAGTPLDKESIAGVIETHMLNPDTFYREHPFPSLAYNHPEYDPEGYWRGRIWPHMVFWMAQTLWLHGYHEQSNTVAKNLLNMMLKSPWICENYNSEDGLGWNPDTNRGWPGYNWCYSTVILLMSGKHKLPPLPEM